MKKKIIISVVTLALIFLGFKTDDDFINELLNLFSEETENVQDNNLYEVVKVVDGDTVKINMNGETKTLRLIGINTPETVDPRKPVQCFGKEASNKAKELLSGKKVKIELDSTQGERDKYNRLLSYVILEDGTNFNKKMISEGYANEYTYSKPYKYQLEFKKAEEDAKKNKLGLWAEDTCNGDTEQEAE